MEEVKLVYYILGISGIIIGFLTQFLWMKFEIKQVRKDMETASDQLRKESESNDMQIEKTRLHNVASLREIYDQKVTEVRNYSKGLYEQRADSISNLQTKVDNIEKKLDSMPTQKSVDEINDRLTNLISLIMSKFPKTL